MATTSILLGAGAITVGMSLLLDVPARRWAAQAQFAGLDAVVAVLNPIGSDITLLVLCASLAIVAGRLGAHGRVTRDGWARWHSWRRSGRVRPPQDLVRRQRPAAGEVLLGPELDSFPSGHATSVFAAATVLGAFYPRVRWPLYEMAAAIALGRVYLDHHASDVVAGALIGLVVASVTLRHRRVTVAGRVEHPSTRIRPVAPFSCIRSPSLRRRVASLTLTTAGKPYSRARIAAWDSTPPISAITPPTTGKSGVTLGSMADGQRSLLTRLAYLRPIARS
jgi:membrane-associated phospholipid phosphatase